MLDEALLLETEAPSTGGGEGHHVSVDEPPLDCQPDHCQSDHDQFQWPGCQSNHLVVLSSGTGNSAPGDRRGLALAAGAALLDSEADGADLLGGGRLCMLAMAECLS